MDKHKLQQRYPDLFDGQEDATFYQLVEALDSTYQAPVPSRRSSWSLIQARFKHAQMLKGAPSSGKWLTRRPSWSARGLGGIAAVLAVLLIAGTVYAAVSPFLRQVLLGSPATSTLVQHDLFYPIHQSKTVAGVTITIEAAYADANELIIADTIITADGHTILWNENRISDNKQLSIKRIVVAKQDGTLLGDTESGKYGVAGSAGQFNDDHRAAEAFYVDTSGITDNPKQLDIQVKMDVGTGTLKHTPKILGSVAFAFSVPFHAGGVINLGQKQTVDGETITLQKAVITPSAVRIFISGQQPWGKASLWATVKVANEIKTYNPLSGSPQEDGSFVFDFPNNPLSEKGGTWTVMIMERDGGHIRTWIFHFTVV